MSIEEELKKEFSYQELIAIQNVMDEWCHYDSRTDEFDKYVMRKVYYKVHGTDSSGYSGSHVKELTDQNIIDEFNSIGCTSFDVIE